ncbi:MAG: HAMP domain-containing protein [Pirellulales bacterium]|nr:HAMP domain-containing protein [Pirellulales bacterium]
MRFALPSFFWRRSIRFRLLAWNSGVVLLLAASALVAVREGSRYTLIAELDERLHEDALEVRLAVQQFYPRIEAIRAELDRKAIGHAHYSMFIEIFDARGQLLASSVQTPNGTPALPGRPQEFSNWGAYRLATERFEAASLPPLAIRVGASRAPIQTEVAKLSRLILLVGLALLPLAIGGGYLLTNRALAPIARIIYTANRLRPTQMEERLPLRGTRDELDKLSLTINRLLDRIAEYLLKHREFVANAAHELRTPLAAIQATVEVGLGVDRDAEEYRELLYSTVDQCRQLGILVNQLLLLAESDSGRPITRHEQARLDQIAEKAVDMFRAAAEEREVRLEFASPGELTVPGDTLRLRQVVNNLLDNALKFTPAGGEVRVELGRDVARRAVVLRVSDTGIGIPGADLPHIFDRFYQVDKSRQREREIHGNGLGLSICHAIAAAHHGTIEISSQLGQGTTVTVTLPMRRGDESAAHSVAAAANG